MEVEGKAVSRSELRRKFMCTLTEKELTVVHVHSDREGAHCG